MPQHITTTAEPENIYEVPPPQRGHLRIVPLGGLGEFGKNCMALECGDDLLMIDCGLKFPEDDMLGVDLVVPDFDYIRRGARRFRGLILTHGHEDHIGAVPYFVRQMEGQITPIYATRLTIELVRSKLEELDVSGLAELIEIKPGERRRIGALELEFIDVAHSVPMAVAVAIETPAGTIVHTGDYKFDPDEKTEDNGFRKFAAARGDKPIALLMADSTNAEREGFSPGEAVVREGLSAVLERAEGAVVMAMFSSSLNRLQTAVDLARESGRKIAVCGYSLERNFEIAARLGLITRHGPVVLPLADVARLPPRERLVLTTGTQGEPLSALSRLALGSFRGYRIGPGDLVVLSSRIIPGNERGIYRMINHFYRRGARVVTEREARVHASGHAYRGEILELMAILKPRRLMPVHGELRQLVGHRDLGLEAGLLAEHVHVLDNGMTFEMDEDGGAVAISTDLAGQMLVDGKLMDGVDEIVLRDRMHLSNDGMLTVILVIDRQSHKIIAGPDMVSRGFVLMDESEELIEMCRRVVIETFEATDKESREEWDTVKAAVRKALRKFIASETDRYPVILPVVVEI